MIGEVMVKFW